LPDQEKYQTTVQIAKPLAQQDGIEPDKKKQEWESIPLPATEEEARQIYHKFEEGAKAVRGDADVSDSVAHHCLKDRTDLLNEKWLGTEQEELDWCASL
jgi:phospholipase D1/2